MTLVDAQGLRCRLAAEVPDPLPGSRRRSRADRLALAAAAEALDDARVERAERAEVAVVVGAVGGGMLEAERWYWPRGGGDPGRRPAAGRSARSFPGRTRRWWRIAWASTGRARRSSRRAARAPPRSPWARS